MTTTPQDTSSNLLAKASRGVIWTVFTSVAAMAISLITQIALGWLLTDRDFGIYAIAIAFADFLRVFRDGGVGLWLARLTSDEYEARAGTAFWLSVICSVAAGAVLALAAFPLGTLYGEPQMAHLILILAVTFPVGAYATVSAPYLQVQLRFRAMASMRLLSAALRYGAIVILAWMGFGPYSFVWPVLLVLAFEITAYRWLTGLRLWTTPFQWNTCRRLLSTSKWSMVGSFATALLRQIDYAIYGYVASAAIVGVYFFAYQLTMQLVLLFSESLRRVVLPIFHRVSDDSGQQQRGLLFSAAFLGLIAGPAMHLLAVVAPDVEVFLWKGRWESAVPSIQILALAMPLHLTAFFIEMLCQSRGYFRLWTLTVFVRGLGLGIAALAGALSGGINDPARVALFVAIYLALSAVLEIIVLLKYLALSSLPMLLRLLPIIIVSGLVAFATIRYFADRGPAHALSHGLLSGAAYGVTVAAMAGTVFHRSCRDLSQLVRRSLHRGRPTRG